MLIEEHALARAEQECLSDAEARRLARERAAERRQAHDAEYLATFAQRVAALFPGCPIEEQRAIAEHACEKYSGRIGRSAAAKELQAGAVDLAVRAHVRHVHTRYDKLLASGVARDEARARVAASVAKCLDTWQHAHRPR